MTATYQYDAFGAVRSHSGSTTEWTFTGEQNDPTGLYYLRARYYDPALGRFLSRDPFTGLLEAPQSLDRYVYVGNDPALYADPRGLWCPYNLEECVSKQLIPEPLKKVVNTLDCLSNPVSCALDYGKDKVERYIWSKTNVVNEALGRGILWASDGDVCNREGGIKVLQNCTGLCRWLSDRMGGRAFTVGSYVFSPETMRDTLLAHESAHVQQYRNLGAGFLPKYFGIGLREYLKCLGDMECAAEHHPMEIEADEIAGTRER